MKDLILMKIGADPEFGYWDVKNKCWVPANLFCGGGSATGTPIGTDGHDNIAEIRPRPNKNILMVMLDLADALHTVGKTIGEINEVGEREIVCVAQPYWHSEPMGGHIHISYWRPRRSYYDRICGVLDRIVEKWRISFIESGGRSPRDYSWREQNLSTRGTKPRPDLVGDRIEYRRPPTWLAHPSLAYSFLGLTKWAFLNGDLDQFTTSPAARVTPDLVYLPKAMDRAQRFVEESRGPLTIDFEAWRNLIE